jgi:hypothetical protein
VMKASSTSPRGASTLKEGVQLIDNIGAQRR